ncbi:MAG: tetratricopeptide repeat protein [Bryobacterales bacterium]|nr:tetratricopeptide repeat protein [Bryobacteraceae bacterium]MDW8130910.1 tetratricopeptide repeat protein [Bryobacterales bacterium]
MRLFWLPLCGWLCAAAAPGAGGELEQARRHYQRTEYREAIALLSPLPRKEAAAWELLGKAWYMEGDYKKASQCFEQAVAAEPGNARFHHWLGRAYGRRAETSSFLTAPGLARKAREHFEKAVRLDPDNIEAVNDLFEYYLQAPGFLGGGLEKAEALLERIGRLDPAERHCAEARLAEKRREFSRAEQHLRKALEQAPRQLGRVIDLAKFLARQRRFEESEALLAQAERIAPGSPRLKFERAAIYIEAGRNLDEARRLLREYLAAPLTPEDPPRRQAEQLLKQLS